MKSAVSIVRCPGYASPDLEARLAECLERSGHPDFKGASVLVKPNLLNANGPERAVTSQPELIRATVSWLKSKGASRVLVGDSPGWQSQDLVGRKSGARDAALAAGAEWADFATGHEVECPQGRVAKRFDLALPLKETDFLVNLPRLKTHQLMYYSGAIKNLFGLVPGLQKSAFHLRFPGREDFAAMLADLCLAAAPDLSILDAVVAMEGPGPNNGRPKELGLLLASRDPLALDWTAAELIGYRGADIPYLADLMERRPTGDDDPRAGWIGSAAEIAVSGVRPEDAKPASFELVPVLGESDFFKAKLPPLLHRFVKDFLVATPAVDRKKCVRCGGCVRICPAKAMTARQGDGAIVLDRKACIRCYCCHEVCPEDAIRLVRRPF